MSVSVCGCRVDLDVLHCYIRVDVSSQFHDWLLLCGPVTFVLLTVTSILQTGGTLTGKYLTASKYAKMDEGVRDLSECRHRKKDVRILVSA